MKEYNHWKESEKYKERKAAEDRAVFWTIILGGFVLLWII